MIDFYNMAFVGFGTLSGIMFSMYHDDFKGSIPFLTHFFQIEVINFIIA